MPFLDAVLLILLLLGNLLAIPIWWRIIGMPVMRLCCWFARRRAESQELSLPEHQEATHWRTVQIKSEPKPQSRSTLCAHSHDGLT